MTGHQRSCGNHRSLSPQKPVGARLPAKTLFLAPHVRRMYRHLRGQARSYTAVAFLFNTEIARNNGVITA